jgi:predicted CoA-binding protein
MQDDIPALRRILARDRTIAVVGLSAERHRPSHLVATYLQAHGYRVVPVNPRCAEILGEQSYARLEDIPFPVDMVNVFRKVQEIPSVASSAVAIGARTLWQQLGLMSEEADRIATAGGLDSVWDRCVKIEHARLFGDLGRTGVSTG